MVSEISASARRTITAADLPESQRHWLRRYPTWQRFRQGVRLPRMPLFKHLSHYPQCVLVAGSQRSGTTMLTRLIAGAADFSALSLTEDDELDAALALAGLIDLPANTRYCLQTTYLNECYRDYRLLGPEQRLIWVVRNPYSVVHSMLHNWRRFGLNELYEACGVDADAQGRLRRAWYPWPLGPSRLEKACRAYRGKVGQILAIRELLPAAQWLVVDYDQIVTSADVWLPRIFTFIGAPYLSRYASGIRSGSLKKADALPAHARQLVEQLALPTYRQALALVRNDAGAGERLRVSPGGKTGADPRAVPDADT